MVHGRGSHREVLLRDGKVSGHPVRKVESMVAGSALGVGDRVDQSHRHEEGTCQMTPDELGSRCSSHLVLVPLVVIRVEGNSKALRGGIAWGPVSHVLLPVHLLLTAFFAFRHDLCGCNQAMFEAEAQWQLARLDVSSVHLKNCPPGAG